MANHPETGVFDSEVIRNVGGALPWLARMPKQPDLPDSGLVHAREPHGSIQS